MRDKKRRQIIEKIGIVFSIICIIGILNVGKIQKILYEKDRYIPFHNLFYEDRETSLSNDGEKILIYDGIALLLRDIKTNREDFVISLESRGNIKDIVWSDDDNYIVYLKDEFNNDFSIWVIDVSNKSNTKISEKGEYANFSWINSISADNFSYAKYNIASEKPIFYSTNLEYLTSDVINDEMKYDEIAFDNFGKQILALKSSKLAVEFYNPSNEKKLGAISIVDSATSGYFEIIDSKAYFAMKTGSFINLYSFDGKRIELLKEDIDKDLKIEKTLIVNGEFAGVYGEKDTYTWQIEDAYKNQFMFVEEKDVNYKLINTSANGERLLVRATEKFDPGDVYLVDIANDKINQIVNIRNFIKKELLYHTEIITLDNDKSSTNFSLTLGNVNHTDNDLFIMLDSDLTKVVIDNKYDPLLQSMADRGINVARISYDYSSFKDDSITIEDQSKKILSDIDTIITYLEKQKNIRTSRVHLISKGKSALLATDILSRNDIDIEGLVLLEPVFDIRNSPYTSTLEKSIVDSFDDYPDIDNYTLNYSVDAANFTVYLNTEVSDSKVTNEFYKNTRKTTDKYLYKKSGIYNEHNIGSTYLLEEYFVKFMSN